MSADGGRGSLCGRDRDHRQARSTPWKDGAVQDQQPEREDEVPSAHDGASVGVTFEALPIHPAGHELDAPPWRRVESTVMATSRSLRRAYDLRLAPTGLNQSEASVLVLLDEDGPLIQSDVAKRIGMRRAAAGGVIDKLEAMRLLERRPDASDRRVWQLVLLPGATPVVEQIRDIDDQLRTELRDGISKEERRQLARTLEQLRVNLAKAVGERALDR